MARMKYDPLEAAKIGADGEKPRAPAPSFKSQDVDVPDIGILVAPPPPPMKHRPHPRYLVLEPGRVSLDGQICSIAKGTVLDSAGYGGSEGIERLRKMGLKLEQVQD